MNLSGIDFNRISNQQDDEEQGPDYNPLTTVAEAKPDLKRPSMYRVVLMNDDYTPMEFVVEVLMTFFAMNEEKATQVMLAVHQQGKGVCGIYSRDVAETKATQVNQFSRQNKHPLLCEVEKV
jgi:ATP-dependent Clp protease adaptor protein ClpS